MWAADPVLWIGLDLFEWVKYDQYLFFVVVSHLLEFDQKRFRMFVNFEKL